MLKSGRKKKICVPPAAHRQEIFFHIFGTSTRVWRWVRIPPCILWSGCPLPQFSLPKGFFTQIPPGGGTRLGPGPHPYPEAVPQVEHRLEPQTPPPSVSDRQPGKGRIQEMHLVKIQFEFSPRKGTSTSTKNTFFSGYKSEGRMDSAAFKTRSEMGIVVQTIPVLRISAHPLCFSGTHTHTNTTRTHKETDMD